MCVVAWVHIPGCVHTQESYVHLRYIHVHLPVSLCVRVTSENECVSKYTISSCTCPHPYPKTEQCFLTAKKTFSQHPGTLDASAPSGGHDALALRLLSAQPGWNEEEAVFRITRVDTCSPPLRLDPQAPLTPPHPFPHPPCPHPLHCQSRRRQE